MPTTRIQFCMKICKKTNRQALDTTSHRHDKPKTLSFIFMTLSQSDWLGFENHKNYLDAVNTILFELKHFLRLEDNRKIFK